MTLIPSPRGSSDHLLDYRLAAAYFAMPIGTLRRWIHERRIKRYGTARHILVDMREVQSVREQLGRHADQPA